SILRTSRSSASTTAITARPAGRRAIPASASIWKRSRAVPASSARARWRHKPISPTARGCCVKATALPSWWCRSSRPSRRNSSVTSMRRSAATASALRCCGPSHAEISQTRRQGWDIEQVVERARLREEDIATRIGRREFIAAGGAAAAWPLAARAQTPAVVRRVGILSAFVPGASSSQRLTGIFSQGLQELGWTDGRNLRIEQRWSGGDNERLRSDAHELMNLPVDVILAITTPAVTMLKQEGTRIPIVFVGVSDPVGSGFVNSLPRPGGNITGFTNLEGSLSGKWLELLKEVVPRLTHAGFMFNPESAPFAEYYLRAFETAAATASVRAVAMPVHDAGDVDKMVAELKA